MSILPLSLTQQDIYFEQMRFADMPMFNVGGYIRFGAIDPNKLVQSHQLLVAKHDAYGIRVRDAEQFISRERSLELPIVDLTAEPDSEQAALKQIKAAMSQPFELDGEHDLFRAKLFKLSDNSYWYMGIGHHLICDGFGFANWARCLGEIYCDQDEAPAMAWHEKVEKDQQYLQSTRYKKSVQYWLDYCKGIEGSFLRKTYQNDDSHRGILQSQRNIYALSEEEVDALEQLIDAQGLTKAAVLSALLGVYCLHAWGKEQILLGLPAHNRQNYAQKKMIGLFTSVLPLKVDMNAQPSFLELVKSVMAEQQRNFRFSGYPLGHLRRSLALNPEQRLYDIGFSYLSTDSNLQLDSGVATLEYVSHDHEATPLMLTAWEYGQDRPLELQLDFNLNYFSSNEADLLIGRLRYLLKQVCLHVDKPVSQLSLVSEQEQARLNLLQVAPEVTHHYLSIDDAFTTQVRRTPDNVALVCDDQQLSYQQLNDAAEKVAYVLQGHGVKVGQPVAVYGKRSISAIVSLLGILKAGAYYVPLNPDDPQSHIEFIINDCKPSVVLATQACEWAASNHIVNWIDVASLLNETQAEQLVSVPYCSENQLAAYVNYTSGTTGRSKGVLVGHQGVLRLVLNPNFIQLSSDTRTLNASSLSFDASTFEIYSALLNGGTLVLYPHNDVTIEALNEVISTHDVNTVWFTAGLFNLWSQQVPEHTQLRYVLAGGDVLSPQAVSRVYGALPQVQVINGYGPTENTTFTCCYPVPRTFDAALPLPIGFAINGTECRVVDSQNQAVAFGLEGELLVAGQGVALEYLNQPELTEKAFVSLPDSEQVWYRTGDLVRYLDNGALAFVGRCDGQIKLRGFRVELNEIELRLNSLSAIKNSVVIAHGEQLNKHLVAYIEAQHGQIDKDVLLEIKHHLSKQLPHYMLPGKYILINDWPLTGNGKIDKRALPDPDKAQYIGQEYTAPAGELEKHICTIIGDVIDNSQVGAYDNFFEVGANSLSMQTICAEIKSQTGLEVSVTDLFEYPTVRQLVQFLKPEHTRSALTDTLTTEPKDIGEDIAVIGLAGRFPGADSPEALWQLVAQGKEIIEDFSEQQLLDAGISRQQIAHPDYVKSGALLNGLELFDADYFSMTPREAQLLDPQERLLLESAVVATENAGYGNKNNKRNIGVFVGIGNSLYHKNHIDPRPEYGLEAGMGVAHANPSSFAATRIAYRLNLNGPAINVATACSTSLLSIHQACNSLRLGECEMALAGGASICQLEPGGYQYQEGGILSKDGHCYAFDSRANGTRGGSGAGMVLLKPLAQAIADGDPIRAVIKGSAINNDGDDKVSYHAPSISGQSAVVREALSNANVDAATIDYIETHGTGTALGDPIEVRSLAKAYNLAAGDKVALGSLKPNIGHLDAAAGIAGFIKLVKAIESKQLPPAVNYEQPNPAIEFDKTPFFVNTQLREWPQTDTPRRGAVSSFGIGGTNVHVIVEQAPESEPYHSECEQLLLVSANTQNGLLNQTVQLSEFLASQENSIALPEVAYTLQVGRHESQWRRAVVCDSVANAQQLLLSNNMPSKLAGYEQLVMMFSGQGSQYLGMAKGLYEQASVFACTLDQCAIYFQQLTGHDLRDFILAQGNSWDSNGGFTSTQVVQPVLFSVEYALAKQLQAWGMRPDVLIGHSLGELVAACVAGVFSLQDAVTIVEARSRLMFDCELGAMVAVGLSEQQVQPYIHTSKLELAAVNAPQNCVVAGNVDDIEAFERVLDKEQVSYSRLHTSHAFHTSMMQPAIAAFSKVLNKIEFQAPALPIIANVTGQLMSAEQATSAEYWCEQILSPVRFAQGIELLLSDQFVSGIKCFVEVGPGNALLSLARKGQGAQQHHFVQTLRHAKGTETDFHAILNGLGQYWVAGGTIEWNAFYAADRPNKVALPTYPFERQRFWLEPVKQTHAMSQSEGKRSDVASWFYQQQWHLSAINHTVKPQPSNWVVFNGQALSMAQLFAQASDSVGSSIVVDDKSMVPQELVNSLLGQSHTQLNVVFTWLLDAQNEEDVVACINWFGEFVKAAGLADLSLNIKVLTLCSMRVVGVESINAEQALIQGIAKVAAQEFSSIDVQIIDIDEQTLSTVQHGYSAFLTDMLVADSPFVAWRFSQRWERSFAPVKRDSVDGHSERLRVGGHYLITGGLGRIGLILAEHLARHYQAKITLLSRSESDINRIMADPDKQHIAKVLQAITQHGGQVIVAQADIGDNHGARQAISNAEAVFGDINGVIHGAADVQSAISPMAEFSPARFAKQCYPKVKGTQVIADIFKAKNLDFCLLMSSLSVQLGGLGYGAYASANAWLDAFCAQQHNLGNRHWVSVNWDGWDVFEDTLGGFGSYQYGMTPDEGATAFSMIMSQLSDPCFIVSTAEFTQRVSAPIKRFEPTQAPQQPEDQSVRPITAPRNRLEENLVALWKGVLGHEVICVDDNFFELGGDSLSAIRVFNVLKQQFDLEALDVGISDFFASPVISDVAKLLKDKIEQQKALAHKEALEQLGEAIEEGEF